MIKKYIESFKRVVTRIVQYYTKENTWKNKRIRRKYKNSFLALKDIHKGERCFIIGNGPSLTANDLSLLKGEYCFAANRIFYMFTKTSWRPTYYCAQDEVVITDIAKDFGKLIPICDKLFLISACYDKVEQEVRDSGKALFFYAHYGSFHKEREFSDRIENYISGGSTITYSAIQIAAYMGFSEIYLLGVDHNYSMATVTKDNNISKDDVKNSYFEGMPTTIKVTKPNTDNSTLSFIKAKEYCDVHGIKIINATRGGKLEVFPRMQLEEILNVK